MGIATGNSGDSLLKHSNSPSPAASRYVVGFDLGTTNSAVTYVDTAEEPWRIETFAVPQVVAPGQVEARETLPSFHYQAAAGELAAGALRCPWHEGRSRRTPWASSPATRARWPPAG